MKIPDHIREQIGLMHQKYAIEEAPDRVYTNNQLVNIFTIIKDRIPGLKIPPNVKKQYDTYLSRKERTGNVPTMGLVQDDSPPRTFDKSKIKTDPNPSKTAKLNRETPQEAMSRELKAQRDLKKINRAKDENKVGDKKERDYNKYLQGEKDKQKKIDENARDYLRKLNNASQDKKAKIRKAKTVTVVKPPKTKAKSVKPIINPPKFSSPDVGIARVVAKRKKQESKIYEVSYTARQMMAPQIVAERVTYRSTPTGAVLEDIDCTKLKGRPKLNCEKKKMLLEQRKKAKK